MILIVVFPSFKNYPERFLEYLEMQKYDNVRELIIYTRELPEKKLKFSNKKVLIKVIQNKFKFYFGIKGLIKKDIIGRKNVVILNHFINITNFSERFKKRYSVFIFTKFYSPNLMFFFKKYSDLKINYKQYFLYLKRSLFDIYSLYFSDAIIGNSNEIESITKKTIAFLGIKRIILTIPTLVDTEFYNFKRKKEVSLEFTILFVGKFLERKGSLDIIKITSLLIKSGIKFRILVAGDLGENLKKYAFNSSDEFNIWNYISFLGFLDKEKLRECYQNADLMLFPSYHEGSPRVVKEAMACGLPVASYDISGIRLIDRGKNVIEFAEVGHVNMLFRNVINLIGNRKQLQKMSERGRTHIEKFFSIKVVIEKQLNKISELINYEVKN